MKYKRKKIIVTSEGNWAWFYIFNKTEDMRNFYHKLCPYENRWNRVGGVSIHREYFKKWGKKLVKQKQTGYVLLSVEYIRPGVVCHEIMHHVFWTRNFNRAKFKKQYPIVIKNMKQEEELLAHFTGLTSKFYTWYWQLKDKKII